MPTSEEISELRHALADDDRDSSHDWTKSELKRKKRRVIFWFVIDALIILFPWPFVYFLKQISIVITLFAIGVAICIWWVYGDEYKAAKRVLKLLDKHACETLSELPTYEEPKVYQAKE